MRLQLEQEVQVRVRREMPAPHVDLGDNGELQTWLDVEGSRHDVYPARKPSWVKIARGPVSGPYRVHEVLGRRLTLRPAYRDHDSPMEPDRGIYGHHVWLAEDLENECRGCGVMIDDEIMVEGAVRGLPHRGEVFAGPFCSLACGREYAEGVYDAAMEARADARREEGY